MDTETSVNDSERIAHPPTVDVFAGALKGACSALKRQRKELLVTAATGPLLNEFADVLGRMERAATPIASKTRRARRPA